MSTYRYTIAGSHSATAYTVDHYHSADIGSINAAVKSNISEYSTINSVYLYCRAKSSVAAGADGYWYFSSSAPYRSGTQLYGARQVIGTSYVDLATYLGSQHFSNRSEVSGKLLTSYSKLAVSMEATVIRKYTCSSVYAEWNYSIPSYTINLTSAGGGTVSGGDKHNVTQFNAAVTTGGSWTFVATPAAGYEFVGWRRVGYTGFISHDNNFTYTIPQIYCNAATENIEGVFEPVGTGAYLKRSGSYVPVKGIYVKQNGVWVSTTKSAFNPSRNYILISS